MSEVTSYAPGTPSWADLSTGDPDAARAFYGAVLGWEFQVGGPDVGHYTNCLTRGKAAAGLMGHPPGDSGNPTPTAWTVYLATADADASATAITAAGGQVMMGPMDVMSFGRMVIAGDPTGAAFGLWQAGEHLGASAVNEAGAMVWHELVTRDLAAAEGFYGALFPYAFSPMDTGPGGPTYHTFDLAERPVGGMMQMDGSVPAEVPAHWSVCFGVEDADVAAARTRELGGEVTTPPTDSPYGRYTVLRDPQGAAFALMGMGAGADG